MFVKVGVFKFCKVNRKTPVLESLFDRVAGLKACSVIEKKLQHRCFPVKFAIFSRTSFLHAGGNLALFEVASYKPLALLTHITQTYTSIETSQLICNANQLTGFYMSVTFARYGLRLSKTLTLRTKSRFYIHGS